MNVVREIVEVPFSDFKIAIRYFFLYVILPYINYAHLALLHSLSY